MKAPITVAKPATRAPPTGDRMKAAILLGQQMAEAEARQMLRLKTRAALAKQSRGGRR